MTDVAEDKQPTLQPNVHIVAKATQAALAALPHIDGDAFSEEDSLSCTKSHLFISYLEHLAFLTLLRLNGESLASAIGKKLRWRLIELRMLLEKGIKPTEEQLNAQADLVKQAGNDKMMQYRPNPNAFLNPVDETGEDDEAKEDDEEESNIYKPPHIAATLLTTTDQHTRRPKNRIIDEYINSEIYAQPQTEESIGRTTYATVRSKNALLSDDVKRTQYEEDNFIRLPPLSKKEKQKQKGQEKRKTGAGGLVNEFGDLDNMMKRTSYNKMHMPRESVQERSQKRAHTVAVDDDVDDAPRVGTAYQKKKDRLAQRQTKKTKR